MSNAAGILHSGQFYGARFRTAVTESFAFSEADALLPSRKLPRHTHASSHFVLVISGAYISEARNLRGAELLGPAALIFNPTGTTHRDRFQSRTGRFLTITPNADISRRLDAVLPVSLAIDNREAVTPIQNGRSYLLNDTAIAATMLESAALELAAHLVPAFERETRHVPGWLLRAKELLRDLCSTDIRISRAAAEVGVHPVHLARAFRRHFYIGPGEYLRRCRMDRARALLLSSTLAIAEIAMEVGFSDQSHFSTAFKRETGLTAAQYRQFGRGAGQRGMFHARKTF